jgi:hypothetical protein
VSALGDAFGALRNVVLMEDRLTRVETEVGEMAEDLAGLREFTHDLDKRLYALERIVDLGARQAHRTRIEEQ